MSLTTEDFASRADLTFDRPASPELVAWWASTFGGRTPRDIAHEMAKGMPGKVRASFTRIDPVSRSFSLDLDGSEANASLWYNSTTLELRAADGGSLLHEEDLGVDEARRGQGLAQTIVGNAAGLAGSMGVNRIRMNAQDVGGYVWARAGALPRSWVDIARPVAAGAAGLLRRGRIEEGEWREICDVVARGYEDPKMIRALSGLRKPIEGADGTTRALGAWLLVGTNWSGEIDLGDPITACMFGRWKECRDETRTSSRRREGPDRPTSPER